MDALRPAPADSCPHRSTVSEKCICPIHPHIFPHMCPDPFQLHMASASALLTIPASPSRRRSTSTYPPPAPTFVHLNPCRACMQATSQENSQTLSERATSGGLSRCRSTITDRSVPPPQHHLGTRASVPLTLISAPASAPLATSTPTSRQRSTSTYPRPAQILVHLHPCGAGIQTTSQASSQT